MIRRYPNFPYSTYLQFAVTASKLVRIRKASFSESLTETFSPGWLLPGTGLDLFTLFTSSLEMEDSDAFSFIVEYLDPIDSKLLSAVIDRSNAGADLIEQCRSRIEALNWPPSMTGVSADLMENVLSLAGQMDPTEFTAALADSGDSFLLDKTLSDAIALLECEQERRDWIETCLDLVLSLFCSFLSRSDVSK